MISYRHFTDKWPTKPTIFLTIDYFEQLHSVRSTPISIKFITHQGKKKPMEVKVIRWAMITLSFFSSMLILTFPLCHVIIYSVILVASFAVLNNTYDNIDIFHDFPLRNHNVPGLLLYIYCQNRIYTLLYFSYCLLFLITLYQSSSLSILICQNTCCQQNC